MGEILISPCDVYLSDDTSVVQPDILFVKKENKGLITKKGIMGPPDLVIEILSTNKDHDQSKKFELYQSNGFDEYLMVDPDSKEVWHYILENGKYVEHPSSAGALQLESLGANISF